MATVSDPSIDELNRRSARLDAGARRLRAEAETLVAEEPRLSAGRHMPERGRILSPWLLLVQGLIGGAALPGASLALLKYRAG